VSIDLSKRPDVWSRRLARARELAEPNPWAHEILTFCGRVLEHQAKVDHSVNAPAHLPNTSADFRSTLDLELAAQSLPELAAMVRDFGPSMLAAAAVDWQNLSNSEVQARLGDWLDSQEHPEAAFAFFPRVLLQPQAERLAQALDVSKGVVGNQCPVCQRRPQLAVIRPEGDGGKRLLLCPLCNTEWEFRRVLCPNCGETNHEKLPRYSTPDFPAVRVEACDTCHTYLKSVDLTIDGHAVPLVDEIAAAPLDLWAVERDYRKLVPNLVGF
jgi:FdhE protein